MKQYLYNTDIGTFEIRRVGPRLYELWINDEKLGDYESPEMAAQDVATFNTDYVEWDMLENELEHVPHGLDDWTPVKRDEP
jgi:hypothetical protein